MSNLIRIPREILAILPVSPPASETSSSSPSKGTFTADAPLCYNCGLVKDPSFRRCKLTAARLCNACYWFSARHDGEPRPEYLVAAKKPLDSPPPPAEFTHLHAIYLDAVRTRTAISSPALSTVKKSNFKARKHAHTGKMKLDFILLNSFTQEELDVAHILASLSA